MFWQRILKEMKRAVICVIVFFISFVYTRIWAKVNTIIVVTFIKGLRFFFSGRNSCLLSVAIERTLSGKFGFIWGTVILCIFLNDSNMYCILLICCLLRLKVQAERYSYSGYSCFLPLWCTCFLYMYSFRCCLRFVSIRLFVKRW